MKPFATLAILALGLFAITCTTKQAVVVPPTARQLDPQEIKTYHNPVLMQIAWMPYSNLELKQTKADNWVIVESDSAKQGVIPVMRLIYPATEDTVWVQMNTKNDLLGKLIKHTLMTQEPISEPYSAYFEKAKCESCHPAAVKVDFNR